MIDETYDAMEKDLTDQITGIKNQILMSTDKHNTVINANRIARTVIEVFDSILEGEKFSKEDLRLILDKILVFEDHIEVQFKPDITAILQSGRMLTQQDAEAMEILQSSEKHRTKALVVTESVAEGAESPNIIRCIDPSQTTLETWQIFAFSMLDLAKRMGTDYYILTDNGCSTVHIRSGSKKLHEDPNALE